MRTPRLDIKVQPGNLIVDDVEALSSESRKTPWKSGQK